MDYRREIACLLASESDIEKSVEELELLLKPPSDSKKGDFAFPCFELAKKLGKIPPIAANELKQRLTLPNFLEKIEVAGGYLNFFVNKSEFIGMVVTNILNQKEEYGKSIEGLNKTIVIDYSSPNVAKRFHVAHLYSTVIGNALYRIHNFLGYNSFGINFLGDWGTQFGKLIVAYQNWGNEEQLNADGIVEIERLYVKFHTEAENDSQLEDQARASFLKIQQRDEESINLWKWFVDICVVEYNKTYERLNIKFDSYNGESFYNDKMEAVASELSDKKLLKKSDGAMIVDLEEYNMPPCLILRSDGGSLYPTRDIASALYRKSNYDFHKALYITDMRQSLHFAQWFKVVGLMGYEWEKDLVFIPYGLLSLENGPLSSRKGNVVLLTDLLNDAVSGVKTIIDKKNPDLQNKDEIAEQVGIGAVIFSSLYNSRIKDVVFSFNKMLNFDGETGPYVQYTHARATSLLIKTFNDSDINHSIDALDFNSIDFGLVNDESSFETVKLLSDFQNKVRQAAERYEPFLISRYLVQLSQQFNKFYHDNHIITAEPAARIARISIVYCVRTVISSGLSLLGISAPNEM